MLDCPCQCFFSSYPSLQELWKRLNYTFKMKDVIVLSGCAWKEDIKTFSPFTVEAVQSSSPSTQLEFGRSGLFFAYKTFHGRCVLCVGLELVCRFGRRLVHIGSSGPNPFLVPLFHAKIEINPQWNQCRMFFIQSSTLTSKPGPKIYQTWNFCRQSK